VHLENIFSNCFLGGWAENQVWGFHLKMSVGMFLSAYKTTTVISDAFRKYFFKLFLGWGGIPSMRISLENERGDVFECVQDYYCDFPCI